MSELKKMEPRISIGMPVYNGEAFIRGALDSLVSQSFEDFELIISDNASTDGTQAICAEYAARDSRIRYVRQQENTGPMANFQFVLDNAVGEYFMWAAADDRRHRDFLDLAVRVLDEDMGVGLVFSDMYTQDLKSGEKTHSVIGDSGTSKKYQKYIFRLANGCPSLIYGLHRTSTLRKIPIETYDFFDVHLTHWYELTSVVRVIPLRLYTAGTNGDRLPYSVSGEYFDVSRFLKNEWLLLRENFGFAVSVVLFSMTWFLYRKAKATLNKIIKDGIAKNDS